MLRVERVSLRVAARAFPRVAAPLAAAAAVAAMPSAATSAVSGPYYVDRESRGGACKDSRSAAQAASAATPWCSLERAVAGATDGSRVLVRGGRYPGLKISGNNARSRITTLAAAPRESVELDGLEIADSSYVRFEGFKLTDDVDIRDGSHHVQFVRNDVVRHRVWLYRTTDVLVAENHIHDIPSSNDGGTIGIRLMHDKRVIVRGNRIENLVEDPIQVTKVTNVLIENNVLRHAHPDDGQHTDTIHVLGADRLTIRGNYAYDIQHGLMFTDFQPRDVTIENNVIARITDGAGMKADGTNGMPNLKVVNNTWWDTRHGVNFRTRHPNAVVRNNIFDRVDDLGDQPTAEHNLIAKPTRGTDYGRMAILRSPTFTDTSSFELAPRSAGVDAGTSVATPTRDRLGRLRSDDPRARNRGGGTVAYTDVGAHERQAGTVRVASTLRLGLAARHGIRVLVVTPPGEAVARVELRRAGERRRLVRETIVISRKRKAVRLQPGRLTEGSYVVSVRFGAAAAALGPAINAEVKLVG